MGEWEWLYETFNGPKEKQTLKYNAWDLLLKQDPYFMEWECPKEKKIINEGA